jgi:hypothetical protein
VNNLSAQDQIEELFSGMQIQECLFCGHKVQLVHVHGHYQCPVCNTNSLPCCDGDNCNTNHLLADHTPTITARTKTIDDE